MNLVFGTAGLSIDNLKKSVKDVYGEKFQLFQSTQRHVNIAQSDLKTKISGFANKDNIRVFLHGFLHGPLPNFDGVNPVDNPNKSAEYLLKRYQDSGTEFLDNIYGHFSVVVYDDNLGKLFLASDPYGHCNIFYHNNANKISFSTNLYSLAKSESKDIKIDRSLEDFFLVYGFYPWQRTPYKGIKYLSTKTILEWHENTIHFHTINSKNPWKNKFFEIKNKEVSEDLIMDKLYDAFMAALKDQLCSEEKVAVLLGGFDSALVAAGLTKLGKKVETFSFYYKNDAFNQPHTDTVSKFLGAKHNWIEIDTQTIDNGMSNYAKVFNKPTNWPNYVIQTQKLATVIKEKGYNYCYSGDGCDYMFFGYPITYKKIEILRKLGKWPEPLVNLFLRLSYYKSIDRLLGRPYHVALGMFRALKRKMPERGMLTFRIFDELCLDQLRNGDNPSQEAGVEDILADLSAPYAGLHPTRLGYIGKHHLAPYKIKMNGSADTTGLVINAPYLHVGMFEFARSLPEKYLRPDDKNKTAIGKYILAKMAEKKQLLPKEVIYQNKVGAVDAPLVDWYANDLSDTLQKLMTQLPFERNAKYIDALIRPKMSEYLWGKMISKDTNNIVTVSHALSLLASYASFTTALAKE